MAEPLGSDIDADRAALSEALARAQKAQVAHGRRVIVLFEGPECAGKKAALRDIASALDPCHFAVHCIRRERRANADGHWLARFWRQLPAAGVTTMFLKSWYRRVLDERLAGQVEGKMLARAYDEINEFEAQQRDYGTIIVKLFFTVDAAEQASRHAERQKDPWTTSDLIELDVGHPEFSQAIEDLRDNSDTRWSPWIFIDGNDPVAATDAALAALVKSYSVIPMEPPQIVAGEGRAA